MVFRNGGMIKSFVPPNDYFLPTAGATPTSYVTARCSIPVEMLVCGSAADRVGRLAGRISHAVDGEFSFNHFGGCGFPIVIDMTAAAWVECLKSHQMDR